MKETVLTSVQSPRLCVLHFHIREAKRAVSYRTSHDQFYENKHCIIQSHRRLYLFENRGHCFQRSCQSRTLCQLGFSYWRSKQACFTIQQAANNLKTNSAFCRQLILFPEHFLKYLWEQQDQRMMQLLSKAKEICLSESLTEKKESTFVIVVSVSL